MPLVASAPASAASTALAQQACSVDRKEEEDEDVSPDAGSAADRAATIFFAVAGKMNKKNN